MVWRTKVLSEFGENLLGEFGSGRLSSQVTGDMSSLSDGLSVLKVEVLVLHSVRLQGRQPHSKGSGFDLGGVFH